MVHYTQGKLIFTFFILFYFILVVNFIFITAAIIISASQFLFAPWIILVTAEFMQWNMRDSLPPSLPLSFNFLQFNQLSSDYHIQFLCKLNSWFILYSCSFSISLEILRGHKLISYLDRTSTGSKSGWSGIRFWQCLPRGST